MKKTIAILLVLVIGMVGVFAANDTAEKTMKINVAVTLINDMVVSETSTPDWNTSASIDKVITSNDEITVGFLHTRSNNYKGYTVWMTPGTLENTTATYGASYLQYTANTYASGENAASATSTTGATAAVEAEGENPAIPAGIAGSADGAAVKIIDSGNLLALTTTYRELKVKIDNTLGNALAGDYNAYITFEFRAN